MDQVFSLSLYIYICSGILEDNVLDQKKNIIDSSNFNWHDAITSNQSAAVLQYFWSDECSNGLKMGAIKIRWPFIYTMHSLSLIQQMIIWEKASEVMMLTIEQLSVTFPTTSPTLIVHEPSGSNSFIILGKNIYMTLFLIRNRMDSTCRWTTNLPSSEL